MKLFRTSLLSFASMLLISGATSALAATEADYKAALAELQIAAPALPNDARILETTGYILRRQGKHEEGLHALEQAVELDPRNSFLLAQIALSYQLLEKPFLSNRGSALSASSAPVARTTTAAAPGPSPS